MAKNKNNFYNFPGMESRGDSIRVTLYFEGDQKKVNFKQNINSANLLKSIYAAKIQIENVWQQGLIAKSEITIETFQKSMRGESIVTSLQPKIKDTPILQCLLNAKLVEYSKMIDDTNYNDNKIKSSTYNSYKNYINNTLTPNFGHLKLNELSKLMIIEWINTLTTSFKYFRNRIIPLKSVYTDAFALKIITSTENIFDDNYIIEYAARVLPSSERKPEPFTENEILIILKQSKSYLKNLIIFGIFSGLRIGELINLKISDISLKDGIINVNSQFSSGVEMSPKTKKGNRNVTILEKAGIAILEQLALCQLHNQTEYLFFNPNTGTRWSSSTKINKHLKKYYEFINKHLEEYYQLNNIPLKMQTHVNYRGFHQCRHTYASMLVATENLWWVASQMGHETIELLINVYGDWIPNDKLSNKYQFRNSNLIKQN